MNNGRAYYNEFDPAAAEWLRQLIADGLITPGVVDERSIVDVQPADLAGFRRVHFFAGIGLWDHALNLAGWGDDEIWTGSCPCQPFSSAGRQQGTKDERHLWPEFMRLIRACRPRYVVGEQVASAPVLGSAGKRGPADAGPVWLDGVFADLADAHYASGALDLPAAGVGAPHIRQRLWWGAVDRMADAAGSRHNGALGIPEGNPRDEARLRMSGSLGADGGLADAAKSGPQGHGAGARADAGAPDAGTRIQQPEQHGDARRLGNSERLGARRNPGAGAEPEAGPALRSVSDDPGSPSPARGLEHPVEPSTRRLDQPGGAGGKAGLSGPLPRKAGDSGVSHNAGREKHPWSDFTLIRCSDGKVRRIPAESEPVFLRVADAGPGVGDPVDSLGDEGRRVAEAAKGYPLALKVPFRVPLLRGVGNAIVPEVGAVFVRAFRNVVNSL